MESRIWRLVIGCRLRFIYDSIKADLQVDPPPYLPILCRYRNSWQLPVFRNVHENPVVSSAWRQTSG